MKSPTIKKLLNETNWLHKLWLGGSLFDLNAQNQTLPQPGKEILLSSPNSRIRYLRELSIDIFLLSLWMLNQSISRRQALLNFSSSTSK